jgi:hypothetical protein
MKQFSNYFTVFFVLMMIFNDTWCVKKKYKVSTNGALKALKNIAGFESGFETLWFMKNNLPIRSESMEYIDFMLGSTYYKGSEGAQFNPKEAYKLLAPLTVSKTICVQNRFISRYMVADICYNSQDELEYRNEAIMMFNKVKSSSEFSKLTPKYRNYVIDVLSKNVEPKNNEDLVVKKGINVWHNPEATVLMVRIIRMLDWPNK